MPGREASFAQVLPRAVAIVYHDPGNRLQQGPALIVDRFGAEHEDASMPAGRIDDAAGAGKGRDPFVQGLMAGAVFADDNKVSRQSHQAPVGVRIHQPAYKLEVPRICNLQQHDRKIAGDGVGP